MSLTGVVFLLLLLPPLVTGAASDARPANSTQYPRNLHRIYDGTWSVAPDARLPFAKIPPPNDRNASDLPTASRAVRSDPNHKYAFRKRSGFALLTAENYQSALGPALNVVFGELVFRDGAYRTPRDVPLRLIGVYEWGAGKMVAVGDVLFEDTGSALQKLYHAFAATHSPADLSSPTGLNMTEERFVSTLSPVFTEHRKRFRTQRTAAGRAGVAAQCPFTATFAVTPGLYNDQIPRQTEYTPFGGAPSTAANPAQVVASASGSSVLNSARVTAARATGALTDPTYIGKSVGSDSMLDSGTNMQDELVEMKGIFVSDACDTKISLVISTLDTETLFGKAINYTLLVTVVAFAQVIVLIRQMEMTSTQAGARRVSLMTVGLQAVADSYLCLGHLTLGIAVQTLFNAFATAAFFKFICFSIFLMRWMLLIWKARRPSGFSEGWEAMRRELSMLYSRFYGSLLLGIFLLYQMQNHLRFFLFALYSFWVPQIVLNVVEDHRRPLLPMYILGTSLTRLAIPLYFWGCPHNFLHIQPQPASAIALVVWLLSQAGILLSQHKFGPRWFIPKAFLPEKYDYYRPITIDEGKDDIEAQEGESGSESRPLVGNSSYEPRRECCICMESVAIHSRERMVTPCDHFFHSSCLERWLEVRLECALCRSPVPPP